MAGPQNHVATYLSRRLATELDGPHAGRVREFLQTQKALSDDGADFDSVQAQLAAKLADESFARDAARFVDEISGPPRFAQSPVAKDAPMRPAAEDSIKQYGQSHFPGTTIRGQGPYRVVPAFGIETMQHIAWQYSPSMLHGVDHIHRSPDPEVRFSRWAQITAGSASVLFTGDGAATLSVGRRHPEGFQVLLERKLALAAARSGVGGMACAYPDQDDPEGLAQWLFQSRIGHLMVHLEDTRPDTSIAAEQLLAAKFATAGIPGRLFVHDDRWMTAVGVVEFVINALKVQNKHISELRHIVLDGTGAAGSTAALLLSYYAEEQGMDRAEFLKRIVALDSQGVIYRGRTGRDGHPQTEFPSYKQPFVRTEDSLRVRKEAMVGCDLYIGMAVPNVVTEAMLATTAPDIIAIPGANPDPEIPVDMFVRVRPDGHYAKGSSADNDPAGISILNNVRIYGGVERVIVDLLVNRSDPHFFVALARGMANWSADDSHFGKGAPLLKPLVAKGLLPELGKTAAKAANRLNLAGRKVDPTLYAGDLSELEYALSQQSAWLNGMDIYHQLIAA